MDTPKALGHTVARLRCPRYTQKEENTPRKYILSPTYTKN